MAQNVNILPSGVFSENINVFTTTTETIVLDNVPCFGYRNIGLTIFNYTSSASSVATVKIYGSTDKIHYKAIAISWSSTAAGVVGHVEVTAVYRYLRVTAAEAANFDVYLDIAP